MVSLLVFPFGKFPTAVPLWNSTTCGVHCICAASFQRQFQHLWPFPSSLEADQCTYPALLGYSVSGDPPYSWVSIFQVLAATICLLLRRIVSTTSGPAIVSEEEMAIAEQKASPPEALDQESIHRTNISPKRML